MAVTFDEQAILLVEDEDFSRSIVSQMLRKIGFGTVLVATGGPQAIEMLGKHRVTAVLTDFRMPGMHGLQLLKAIRTGNTPASRDLPCAMLTSYAERHLVGLAIVLDVDTFLAKPVSLEVLNKHLGRIFQYRFEPQPVPAYNAVDVDNVAPHLTGAVAPLAFQEPAPVAEDELKPLPLDEFDTQPPPLKPEPAPVPAPEPARTPATKEARPAAAAKSAPAPTGKAIQVRLADVPEDALLAKDLVGAGGTLLLSAGTPFKRRYVKRLEELQTFRETVDSVWIIAPTEAA